MIACRAVGGGFDYVLQVVTHDIKAYQRLVDRMLEARVGLCRYFTYVATKSVKVSPVLLERLLAMPRPQ